MHAPEYLLKVWKQFDCFPMETLTKLWYYQQPNKHKQRDVSLIKEHREQYGLSGNCFDLAFCLLDAFQKEGITAYPIGHGLHTEDVHVAVIALDEQGNRYLCDLGDQWIIPILLEKEHDAFTEDRLSGFFPGAMVQVQAMDQELTISFQRPNDKISRQSYDLTPIDREEFTKAAESCQRLIDPVPLLEYRMPYKREIAHWEFDRWSIFLSTKEGLLKEPRLTTIEGWAERIHQVTGGDKDFVRQVLEQYQQFS
ncbi:hypothetical protein [Gracilibacillus alcaliphilus]|uniref:hypothetical protein n=1 Tax=Gracilibacillus alcaliphilus TaxID=1401441 RepID=UPI00195E2156|nr:hypothetical protein [Gracilibacillus alcaliphilus]MBM7676455.1 hypothetical protein [Gracilibacillus alcaliphilus]